MSPNHSAKALTLSPAGPVHWAVMLAQGWKGELGHHPERWLETAMTWATETEALGFDGLWVFDHFTSYPDPTRSTVLEAWTTLGALSRSTQNIVLGTLVSCAAYRPPHITARMAATLNTLSGGRFCLGLGAGWDEAEFQALDLPFPDAAIRSTLLEQAVVACRKTGWIDQPTPPALLIGGEGEKRTLQTAARYADLTNWQVGVEAFEAKSLVLDSWCAQLGRDYTKIRRTHATNVKIFESEAEFRRWTQSEPTGMSSASIDEYIRRRGAFYGTAERIAQTIADFLGAGCRGFMLYCNDAPDLDALRQLSTLRP